MNTNEFYDLADKLQDMYGTKKEFKEILVKLLCKCIECNDVNIYNDELTTLTYLISIL